MASPEYAVPPRETTAGPMPKRRLYPLVAGSSCIMILALPSHTCAVCVDDAELNSVALIVPLRPLVAYAPPASRPKRSFSQ